MLAALLLAGGGVLAQSGGSYDLGWQVIGSAGEQFVVGGGYQIGFTLAQNTPPLISAGGRYQVVQGYWSGSGGPACPRAVADLQVSNENGCLRLDWTAVTQNVEDDNIPGVTYNIYRAADAPYFTAGTLYAGDIADTWYVDPDHNVIGHAQHSYYYLIKAVCGGLTSSDSNRAGRFSFDLLPGTQLLREARRDRPDVAVTAELKA